MSEDKPLSCRLEFHHEVLVFNAPHAEGKEHNVFSNVTCRPDQEVIWHTEHGPTGRFVSGYHIVSRK